MRIQGDATTVPGVTKPASRRRYYLLQVSLLLAFASQFLSLDLYGFSSQQEKGAQLEIEPHPPLLHSCNIGNETVTFPIAPHIIIIGAQKSGTTTLFNVLKSHSSILPPGEHAMFPEETHFFDLILTRMTKPKGLSREDLNCRYRQEYAKHFDTDQLSVDPTLLAMEKTPSYIMHDRIPGQILDVCPWKPKIIVILRDPIDRAFSQYNMRPLNRTFEFFLEQELLALNKLGLSTAPTSISSTYDDKNMFSIPNITTRQLVLKLQNRQRPKFLQRGMYWIQLLRWKQVFGDSLLVLNHDDLVKDAQSVFDRIFEFCGISRMTLPSDHHSFPGNYNSPMSNTTRQYLQDFFRPHNAKLSQVLGEEWSGVWNYDGNA